VGFSCAGVQGGFFDGAFLHFGHATGDADDDAGTREGDEELLMGFLDEVAQHRLRDIKLRDYAIS
jgi:hypothetical protein